MRALADGRRGEAIKSWRRNGQMKAGGMGCGAGASRCRAGGNHRLCAVRLSYML